MNAQQERLTWTMTNGYGPATYYAEWMDAPKVFSIYTPMRVKGKPEPQYHIKCGLPGFRTDLPTFTSVDAAKAFCEKMLTRWVAKRGLLFKTNIVVTDAMKAAFLQASPTGSIHDKPMLVESIIKAVLDARG